MSQRALLLAVRDQLKSALSLTAAQCEVAIDGQPPPACGELFVAVHPLAWAGGAIEGLEETYSVGVTVTVRSAKVPRDRWGASLLAGPAGASLDEKLEAIRAAMHKDKGAYPVLAAANTTIGAGENGFVEPLVFKDGGRPEPKGPDWFSAEVDVEGSVLAVGLAQTLTFGDAKRYQVIEEQS